MAKTSYLIIPAGFVDSFYSAVASKDRFQYARIAHINRLLSFKQRKKVKARSLLPQIRDLWNGLTGAQKTNWGTAGAIVAMTGYRLFVQDTTRRIQSEVAGTATPSILHQSLVGQFTLVASSDAIKLIQEHPQSYWVQHKVTGKQKVYEPVVVTENFALPLVLTISYKSDLTAGAGDPYARYYAKVKSRYQGRTIVTDLVIELDLSSGWTSDTATLSSVVGVATGYDLYLETNDVSGSFLFDTIKATHSGQNWARDPFCNDIRIGFTRAFYQVAKFWAPQILTAGADYGSVYPAD